MQQEELNLKEEITKLNAEGQEFITIARKEHMSDEEFTQQISALYDKERGAKRRLPTIERAKDNITKLYLKEQGKKYVGDLQSEINELIRADPQTSEENHQVFLLKKRIVDIVLVGARVDENREIHIKFRADSIDHAG